MKKKKRFKFINFLPKTVIPHRPPLEVCFRTYSCVASILKIRLTCRSDMNQSEVWLSFIRKILAFTVFRCIEQLLPDACCLSRDAGVKVRDACACKLIRRSLLPYVCLAEYVKTEAHRPPRTAFYLSSFKCLNTAIKMPTIPSFA